MKRNDFVKLQIGLAAATLAYWESVPEEADDLGGTTKKEAAGIAKEPTPAQKAAATRKANAAKKAAEQKAAPETFNMADASLSDVVQHLEKEYNEGTYSILPASISNIGILPAERQAVYLARLGTANIKNFLQSFDVEAAVAEGVNIAQVKMMMAKAGPKFDWTIDNPKNQAAIDGAIAKAGEPLWKFMKNGDEFGKVAPDFMALSKEIT